MDRMLRPSEVTERIPVIPEKTLANWRSRGEGPPYLKIGGRIYYPESDLDEWLADRYVRTG